MQVGGTAFLVAVAGVILPVLAGWGICALWGDPRIESIFTGAAMVATSVGITAQVLAARGLLDTRAARIILAAAVVDDVLGLIVLALVSDLARGCGQLPRHRHHRRARHGLHLLRRAIRNPHGAPRHAARAGPAPPGGSASSPSP